VISTYHDRWQVKGSFRMTKIDIRARAVFHYQPSTIEAPTDASRKRSDELYGEAELAECS
jgi:hypothetical protein